MGLGLLAAKPRFHAIVIKTLDTNRDFGHPGRMRAPFFGACLSSINGELDLRNTKPAYKAGRCPGSPACGEALRFFGFWIGAMNFALRR
jgi:hypothetical protein